MAIIDVDMAEFPSGSCAHPSDAEVEKYCAELLYYDRTGAL
jgi:hypothetical protein